MTVTFLILSALHDAFFASFHLLFPKLFGWRKALTRLDPVNHAIVHVMNLALACLFALAALFCGWLTTQPALDTGSRVALTGLGAFWLVRALLQPLFFQIRHPISLALAIAFAVGGAFHLIAAQGS